MARIRIDAHCHIADISSPARAEVLTRCRQNGVNGFVMGGVDPADWQRQRDLAASEPCCWRSAGLHPWSVARLDDAACDAALETLEAALEGAIALGETGLDLAIRQAQKSFSRQLRCFVWQLELARRLGMPLVLHVVRAHAESCAELERIFHGGCRGMVHDFQGSLAEARRYHALGLLISLGPRAEGRVDASLLRELPPEAFVLETDSPHVPGARPPDWRSGAPLPDSATPLRILEVAAWAAREAGGSASAWLDRSTGNLCRVFAIPAAELADAEGASQG